MPRKNQKNEKKSLEVVSRGPSRSPAAALLQEKPQFAAATQNIGVTNEFKQPAPETSKMAANWDRLMVKTAADIKLPVAASSKSASNQLEVPQTRQTRRSRDVSREIENADTNPPIEASLVVTPKRSGTPSFFEANKKMKMTPLHLPFDNSKPKSADAKLPVAVATSKKLEGKSFKTSELELNQNKENAKRNENPAVVKGGLVHFTLPQGVAGQGPAPKPASSVADIEEAPCDSMEVSARGMLAPSGKDKYYLEQFHKFYEDYKACNAKIAKRLLKLENSNTQKHYENMSLKSRLDIMTDKKTNLENRVSLQDQMNNELNDKYLDALKARSTVEKTCQSQLERAKSLIDQQKAELGENQSEIDRLRAELKNMQETNRGMGCVLSDLQIKLKNTEETATNLLNQNNKQAKELEEQKLKIQDGVAERETLERRNSQLESELEERTLECNDLKQRQVDFEELQLQNEEIANQLESSQTEKETMQNFLKERIQELEASRNVLIEFNEEYSKESIELKADKEALKETISNLRTTLSQQAHDLKELTESHEQLQVANLQQFSQHSAELQECKAQNMKLEEIIKSFENKLQAQAQSLKTEQENRIKETRKGEVLKSELEGERERYQADIDALKTALEHRDKHSSVEQAKIRSLNTELEELRKINIGLKDENKQMGNEISAAKKKFDEEIKELTNSLKNKIFGLQEDLKQKEVKLIGLEHEKNGIIKQLKEKMSTICSTIEQPIIASAIAGSPEPAKSLKRLPRKSQEVKPTFFNRTSGSAKTRRGKRIDYINIESDFESEDDEIPVKMLITKRENLAVVMPQEDLFDALKNGTT